MKFILGKHRKNVVTSQAGKSAVPSAATLSTDEVLERIQQQMEEVMATAQEVANSAVSNENEARVVSGGDATAPTTTTAMASSSTAGKQQNNAKNKRGGISFVCGTLFSPISFYSIC